MMDNASKPGPRTRAFVDWTLRYGRWIWLVAILLAIPAFWRTTDRAVALSALQRLAEAG